MLGFMLVFLVLNILYIYIYKSKNKPENIFNHELHEELHLLPVLPMSKSGFLWVLWFPLTIQ